MSYPLTALEALHTADFTPTNLKNRNQNVFTQSDGTKKRKHHHGLASTTDVTPNSTSKRYFQPTRKLFIDSTDRIDSFLSREYSVSNTVSSIAITNDRKYLVIGFYSGSIFLYPLQVDYAVNFRNGILLDQITPRGIYTQLMVRVVVSDDNSFIFAGVYRGSTEIRAIQIDSIEMPSISCKDSSTIKISDRKIDSEKAPVATCTSYTFSDAKLKGFAAAKSLGPLSHEYRLLCGLGIKNIHMWRFYRKNDDWAWECIFDKQSNGISLELLSFCPGEYNTIISKSEHQCIRMWELEPTPDCTIGLVTKKAHKDIKNTIDAFALHENLVYCGTDTLSIIDVHTGERIEHSLPEVNTAHSTKQPISRRMRRSGTFESAVRHMRTVAQISSSENCPFSMGMCSDGSVFLHDHKDAQLGMASPLQYISGYETFFQDPTLTFQAQFSDLTRMNNANGVLAILPLLRGVDVSSDEWKQRQNWLVATANQSVLQVRTLAACIDDKTENLNERIISSGNEVIVDSRSQCPSSSEEEWDGDISCDKALDIETEIPTNEPGTHSQECYGTPDTLEKADAPVKLVQPFECDVRNRTPTKRRPDHCDRLYATNGYKSVNIDPAGPLINKQDDSDTQNKEGNIKQPNQKRYGRRAVARALLCSEDNLGLENQINGQTKVKSVKSRDLSYQCQRNGRCQIKAVEADITLLELSRMRKGQNLPSVSLPKIDGGRSIEQEVLLAQFALQWHRHYNYEHTASSDTRERITSRWILDQSKRFIDQTKQLHGLQLLEAKAHHAMVEYESFQYFHKQHK
ncbi:unnamed protein product [Albugo candida]|uniref:Uncharacterized protein n=1 Tax=Albugo candida TaxID=65357 RepID=A0A024GBQ0_9STRA|nr:unnamed protein product [Albugo candida]|eukprot:CCI44094.1 unnamed protein product [Albugo candida]